MVTVFVVEASGGTYSDSWSRIAGVYSTLTAAQEACGALARGLVQRLRTGGQYGILADDRDRDLADEIERAAQSFAWRSYVGLDGDEGSAACSVALPSWYAGTDTLNVMPFVLDAPPEVPPR